MRYAIYNPAGEITKIVGVPHNLVNMYLAAGEQYIEANDATLHDLVDLSTKTLIKNGKGTPPAPGWVWDSTTMKWVADMQALKAIKKMAIERERDRLMLAPIKFGGAKFDADASALDRLTKKLAIADIMVEKGIDPDPSTLVWHDADNVDHTFDSLPAYREFLQGLALAIDARAMKAWGWSWVRKGELTAATAADQVNAIVW